MNRKDRLNAPPRLRGITPRRVRTALLLVILVMLAVTVATTFFSDELHDLFEPVTSLFDDPATIGGTRAVS